MAAVGATVLKMLTTGFLTLLFDETVVGFSLADSVFWLEVLINGLCAPVIFALLGLFPSLYLVKGNR